MMDSQERRLTSKRLERIAPVIRDVVFGVEDSLVSTLGVLTGIASGTADHFVVILSGVVVVLVEALSMAAGTYLSAKSEREVQARRLQTERETIEATPGSEIERLRAVYRERGFGESEIAILVNRVARDRKLMLEELALHGLHIPLPMVGERPTRNAVAMGLSYLAAGVVPIAPYLFLEVNVALAVSVTVTVAALFLVGTAKGSVAGRRKFASGLEMATISTLAAGVGFLVGRIAAALFDVNVS